MGRCGECKWWKRIGLLMWAGWGRCYRWKFPNCLRGPIIAILTGVGKTHQSFGCVCCEKNKEVEVK